MTIITNINTVKYKIIRNKLNALIENNREMLLKNNHIEWNDNHWMINNKKIKFTRFSDGLFHNELMDKNFINFAKLYIAKECLYFTVSKIKRSLCALRILEKTLSQLFCNGDIGNVNLNVLDESVKVMKDRLTQNSCYRVGGEIERIALFLVNNNLTYKNIHLWKNPIKYDMEYFLYDGKPENSKKMPSEIALNAFAEIFSQPLENKKDIFTTSVVALLISAPSRISEILSLPADCYITEKTRKGDTMHGLRFWAGKGYGGDIKWIVSVMAHITKLAIDRIYFLTIKSRSFAKLMELDFKEFHKQSIFSSLPENTLLTKMQVLELLGSKIISKNDCNKILRTMKLSRKDYRYTIKNIWDELQLRLPDNFPWYDKKKNLKYSDLLFLSFKNSFSTKSSENFIQLHKFTDGFFTHDIKYRKCYENIFQRHGYTNENGGDIYFSSHQVRHLLNTLAQRNGLTEEEIAKWSGRANPLQNRVYNHRRDEEILEQFESIQSETENYSISGQITISDPMTKESYLSIGHSAVHTTEFGYCVHDYTISPCEKFRDCINCSEQICIKGCYDSLDRLKTRLLDTERLIQKVTNEADNQNHDLGKDRWLTFHLKTKERLQELIGILENKDIPDNSFIRLTNKSYSHLSRTISTIKLLESKKGETDGEKNN
ncbi:hypothetical protein [Dickeya fangzhongdai]|uniref:hypothetical protein n=1 Tax=Dickeya fangzhongdai TaxID=1778540 RepID=UPI0026E09B25|nr:hypothetical protein [Dickeya fangzhongdai]WKV52167.1 hypothetical protein PL145_08115 [Dickeya fangzhongdai]